MKIIVVGMRVYKCDKCGRIVENGKDITKVSVSYFEKDEALLIFKEVKEDFEFCKNCRNLVLDFLKMHKGGGENE
jgi:RNA polymerase subunit RPABC4/transcription elongation factor Spt4